MAQTWVMRANLVHGQGNFGSVGGDRPAHQRYTEAKLTAVADALMAELGQAPPWRCQPQLRQHAAGAHRPAGAVPQSAGQRQFGHRRGLGDQHSAAQPGRGVPGGGVADRQPGIDDGPVDGEGQGAGLPPWRPGGHRPGHVAQDLRRGHGHHQDPGRLEGRGSRRQETDRHHLAALRRGQGEAGKRYRNHHLRAAVAAVAQPGQRVEREGRVAHRPGNEGRQRPQPDHGLPVQAHVASGDVPCQPDLPGAGEEQPGEGSDAPRSG